MIRWNGGKVERSKADHQCHPPRSGGSAGQTTRPQSRSCRSASLAPEDDNGGALSTFPPFALSTSYRQAAIQNVRDEHTTRRMCDCERDSRGGDHRLWSDTTGPENRQFVSSHYDGIAVVGSRHVSDADLLWVS